MSEYEEIGMSDLEVDAVAAASRDDAYRACCDRILAHLQTVSADDGRGEIIGYHDLLEFIEKLRAQHEEKAACEP